jgi:Phage antirepressor protein KilAC domain
MVKATITPYRWTGYGLDLRAFLGGRGPLFFAEDICDALNVTVPAETDPDTHRLSHRWPAGTVHHVDVMDDDNQPVPMFGIDEIRRLCQEYREYGLDLMLFIDIILDELTSPRGAEIIALASPLEPGLKELDTTYSVTAAARILSRDPALDYGRDTLFETMRRALDMIERRQGIWVPKETALRAGHLVRHNRIVTRGRIKEAYPQIRITRTGLELLHHRLGGVAQLTLDGPEDLALVEI